MSEFGVYGDAQDRQQDAGCVIGRCHKGPLRVGDVFVSSTDGNGQDVLPIRLVVLKIELYRRYLNEITEGLTARLFLEGEGWYHVFDRRIITTDQ